MNNAELFKRVFGIYAEEFWAYPEEKMLDWLNSDAPTASSVEIVRCYACKYREGSVCDYSAVYVRPNGYCQWGEKEDAE